MTVSDLQVKREQILRSVGKAREQFGERSIEYSRQSEALALIDREIALMQSPGDRAFTIQTNRGLS